MPTSERWIELHDAVLESLELRWSSGDCDRQMPWGISASINEVRGPTTAGDGAFVLEIEMQSRDLIRIEAGAFSLEDTE